MKRVRVWLFMGGLVLTACSSSTETENNQSSGKDAGTDATEAPGGAGGTSGTGGAAGTAGTGGTAGHAGTAGSAGQAGAAGQSGSAGSAGSSGSAGQAGAAGQSGSAGSAGSSGSAGQAGSGGASPGPECTQDSDCTLHSDCCNCMALAPGEVAPDCPILCVIDTCTSLGFSFGHKASCIAGHCSVGFDCDPSNVTCKSLPPDCDPGMSNSVFDQCWGPCVPSSDCAAVPSCKDCDPSHYVCVSNDAQMSSHHCVEVPDPCDADRSCQCMGDSVCVGIFDVCVDSTAGANEIHCVCPACK